MEYLFYNDMNWPHLPCLIHTRTATVTVNIKYLVSRVNVGVSGTFAYMVWMCLSVYGLNQSCNKDSSNILGGHCKGSI